jgi:hypothetical protein
MSDEPEILIDQIRELRAQYIAEVGEGRRAWPKSIRERVQRLDELGMSAREASERTGVGYETFLQWRYQRKQQLKKQFHQIAVKALSKIGNVTVPKMKKAKPLQKIGTVTVTTPEGYRVEIFDVESAIYLLKNLSGAKCS